MLADSIAEIPAKGEHYRTIKLPASFSDDKPFRMKDVIDSIWYLPLETNDSSVISYIEQVAVFKDYYIILDIFSNKVMVFNKQGKFVRQLGHNGRGPGEYLDPNSFIIDKEKEEIIVHDDRSNRVIYYDINGKVIKEKMAKYRFNQFVKYGDHYVINSDRSDNNHLERILNRKLLFTSPDWKVSSTAFTYDWETQQQICTSLRSLIQTGDHINYNPAYTYDIYAVTDSSIEKKYFVDAGNFALPEGFDKNLSIADFSRKYEKDHANRMYISTAPLETDKHLVLTFSMNKQFIFSYYSKKTGKLYCNPYFINDIPGCMGPVSPVDVDGDTFIGSANAIQVGEYIRDLKYYEPNKPIPPAFASMSASVKDIDNPILVFFKLKDF